MTPIFIRSSLTIFLSLIAMCAFVFAPAYTHAQIWNPPTGAPPNNNAPEPIHEGVLGQGKYWGDLSGSSYTIGAFLFIAEGLLSDWLIADNQGVAATQYCLGTESAIATSGFPSGIEGLDCITAETGWPTDGGGGGDGNGDGNGIELPAATAGQTLFYNEALGVWQASEFLRSIDGGIGDEANKIMFGYQTPLDDDVETQVSIHGTFKYTVPNQPGSFYNGKILGTDQNGGTVEWLDPSSFNLGLPAGNLGDIMYWNGTEWINDNSFFIHNTGNGDRTAIINKIGFSNNANIPGNDYLNCVGDQILRLAAGNNNFGADLIECTSKVTINESMDIVTVDAQNAIFTKLEHTNDIRPVCAEEDGDVVLCDNLTTGDWTEDTAGSYTFEVPFGVYEITATLTGGGGGGGGGGFGKALYMLGDVYALSAMGGGGGGGGGGRGETTTEVIEVEPGQELTIVVGNGGLGGCAYRANIASGGDNNGCNDGPYTSLANTGLYTAADGANGGQSKIQLGNTVLSSATGGFGGEGGFTFNPNLAALSVGLASPGGDGGQDWDGDVNAGDGDAGGNLTPDEENNLDYIISFNWNGGNPDHSCGFLNPNECACIKQKRLEAGGDGGNGSGGVEGGIGGDSYIHGSHVPEQCQDMNYLNLPAIGNQQQNIGYHGQNGPTGSGFGGGGGGGGSSIAGTYSQTSIGTADLGYGGYGGDGGSGSVVLSW